MEKHVYALNRCVTSMNVKDPPHTEICSIHHRVRVLRRASSSRGSLHRIRIKRAAERQRESKQENTERASWSVSAVRRVCEPVRAPDPSSSDVTRASHFTMTSGVSNGGIYTFHLNIILLILIKFKASNFPVNEILRGQISHKKKSKSKTPQFLNGKILLSTGRRSNYNTHTHDAYQLQSFIQGDHQDTRGDNPHGGSENW